MKRYENELFSFFLWFSSFDSLFLKIIVSALIFLFNTCKMWLLVLTAIQSEVYTGATQRVQQVQRPLYWIYAKFRWVRRDFPTSSVTRGNSSGFVGFSLSQLVLLSRSSLHCVWVTRRPDFLSEFTQAPFCNYNHSHDRQDDVIASFGVN